MFEFACLSLQAHVGASLPIVYLNVAGSTEKWRSAVDSCSTGSLIRQGTVAALCAPVLPVEEGISSITAIDGNALPVLGAVSFTVTSLL